MTYIHIAVTAHGYGHLAQVAPVANLLRRRLPDLRVTLQGTVAEDYVRARLEMPYRHIDAAADVALPMDGPLHARWEEGLAVYAAFDRQHDAHLAAQRALLAADPPDLVLADIPWLPLAAARSMGIPAVGLCSLSWYDILAESPVGARMPASLADHQRAAYAGADLFIRPAPTMPMAWLPNGRDIGPIAMRRRRDQAAVRARFGVPPGRQLVLMQFGGAGRLRLGRSEPLPASVHLLTPDPAAADGRADIGIIPGDAVPDVLASCDALITKPGYGTFAEAACNGIPVLYVPREDWPEEPHLVEWLAARVPSRAVSEQDLAAGRIAEPLRALLDAGLAPPVEPTGTDEAVELLLGLLARP
jgi:UDP:flavonoid glycosyltransferase YjiC (YdhE family)